MATAKCVLHSVATLTSVSSGGVSSTSGVLGVVTFRQQSEDGPTVMTAELRGLYPNQKHGVAIHAYGDLSDVRSSIGPIFNPFGATQHGFPSDDKDVRFVGGLGNVQSNEDGKAVWKLEDSLVKLLGPHSVIGRSLVIHASQDDGGRGGHETSFQTGNTGPCYAAGIIGIAKSN